MSESGSLLDGMKAIQSGGLGFALVLDAQRRLAAILTDSDVRRALLEGRPVQSPLAPWAGREYQHVGPSALRADVLDLLTARQLNCVPILDGERHLLGLHLRHELIGSAERPNWAVILAGGKGMRLRPTTEHLPKPMIRVAGRPILERLVCTWSGLACGASLLRSTT